MEKVIVKQIKSYIEKMQSETSLKNMRKSSYADGYNAALNDVKSIITLAEELGKSH